jgi:hypothetical protein
LVVAIHLRAALIHVPAFSAHCEKAVSEFFADLLSIVFEELHNPCVATSVVERGLPCGVGAITAQGADFIEDVVLLVSATTLEDELGLPFAKEMRFSGCFYFGSVDVDSKRIRSEGYAVDGGRSRGGVE